MLLEGLYIIICPQRSYSDTIGVSCVDNFQKECLSQVSNKLLTILSWSGKIPALILPKPVMVCLVKIMTIITASTEQKNQHICLLFCFSKWHFWHCILCQKCVKIWNTLDLIGRNLTVVKLISVHSDVQ